jgi:hypothetical protein
MSAATNCTCAACCGCCRPARCCPPAAEAEGADEPAGGAAAGALPDLPLELKYCVEPLLEPEPPPCTHACVSVALADTTAHAPEHADCANGRSCSTHTTAVGACQEHCMRNADPPCALWSL